MPFTTTTDLQPLFVTGADDDFDYTRFVLRTDRSYPPLSLETLADLTGQGPDLGGLLDGAHPDVLRCVLRIWAQLHVPAAGVAAMAGVLQGLMHDATEAGLDSIYDLADHELTLFVTTNTGEDAPTTDEMRVRRNVINGTFLALEDAGLLDDHPLLQIPDLSDDERNDQRGKRRHNAMGKRTRNTYEKRDHVRPATHDEVLLTRLATRLVGTTRATNLSAACVAVCTSTAATSEAPQVLWQDRSGDELQLVGRTSANGNTETDIAARTVILDAWAVRAISAWAVERTTSGPLHPASSMLYSGTKPLTDNSAQVCVDKQVRNAMERAGITNIRGLSAGSLRLWGAIKDATDPDGVRSGAERAGIRVQTLHRTVHQLGERSF